MLFLVPSLALGDRRRAEGEGEEMSIILDLAKDQAQAQAQARGATITIRGGHQVRQRESTMSFSLFPFPFSLFPFAPFVPFSIRRHSKYILYILIATRTAAATFTTAITPRIYQSFARSQALGSPIPASSNATGTGGERSGNGWNAIVGSDGLN